MKEYIAIQTQSATDDGQGGSSSVSWSTVASEWAKATVLSYSRTLLDGGIIFSEAVQFEMRERGDTYTLSGEYAILWNSVRYTIHSVVSNSDRTTVLAYRK